VSVSTVLYPRWRPLLKIEISSNGQNLKFGYFLAKIEQFWPFEEISIFSNGGHLGWRAGLSDTILKGTHPGTIPARFGLICPLPKLCPVIPTSNQDGRQAKNRKKGDEIFLWNR
jgi:hypothetical protein